MKPSEWIAGMTIKTDDNAGLYSGCALLRRTKSAIDGIPAWLVRTLFRKKPEATMDDDCVCHGNRSHHPLLLPASS